MKKLFDKISILVAAILFWAIAGAFLFAYKHYLPAVFCLFILIYTGYKLYRLNIKTTSHFKHFIDSIKFSESSISFISDVSDPVYQDYYDSLAKALEKINFMSQKRESDISFYNTLLNRIDFALIITDREEKIVWINKIALDLLGRPKPTNLEVIKKLSKEFREVFESLQPKFPKTLRLEINGQVKILVVNLSIINIQGDKFYIYSLKDIQSVVDETEESAWQQLISVLTHEIMNSLTPIISLSENLSGDKEDPELLSKAMETIHRRSKGLVSFVNNYKKLTQIPTPQRSHINIKSLIDDIVSLMNEYEVEFHTLVTSDNLILYADREQIEQVLINLVKNAQEACLHTGNPSIRITATDNIHGQIIITIADNGSGMEPDILEKIFTPFYTTKPNGSGIGLSLCRQIIAMHGGMLTATSIQGEGSLFTIRI